MTTNPAPRPVAFSDLEADRVDDHDPEWERKRARARTHRLYIGHGAIERSFGLTAAEFNRALAAGLPHERASGRSGAGWSLDPVETDAWIAAHRDEIRSRVEPEAIIKAALADKRTTPSQRRKFEVALAAAEGRPRPAKEPTTHEILTEVARHIADLEAGLRRPR